MAAAAGVKGRGVLVGLLLKGTPAGELVMATPAATALSQLTGRVAAAGVQVPLALGYTAAMGGHIPFLERRRTTAEEEQGG